MTVRVGITPIPPDVSDIADRLLKAALDMEETADNCARSPVPAQFDDLLKAMISMLIALDLAFEEIEG